MKRTQILLPAILLLSVFTANAQNYSLLPETFFLHKGDKLNIHLILGEDFSKDEEIEFRPAETARFSLYEDNKKSDLLTATKEGSNPVFSADVKNDGLVMLDMARKQNINEVDHDKFVKFLDDEGLTKLSDKAKNSNAETFRDRSTWFMKALVLVADKKKGDVYDKPQGDDFEITLQQNPYKQNYGDDITGVVTYKGRPAGGLPVDLYIRTPGGTVFPQRFTTDGSGMFYFKTSREGIYFLHTVRMDLSKDHEADFDSWHATFTFGFSSQNELPNTYKEFGFGNKH